jgi:hypothetical protein
MDYVKAEPDADNESFLVRPATDATLTEVKDEDHLKPPVFCAVKSEPQVRFSCSENNICIFLITVFVSGIFCFRMRLALNPSFDHEQFLKVVK